MWKNSLKNVESDNNKILYETLIDFFLQRNGTYFLNKLRTFVCHANTILQLHHLWLRPCFGVQYNVRSWERKKVFSRIIFIFMKSN